LVQAVLDAIALAVQAVIDAIAEVARARRRACGEQTQTQCRSPPCLPQPCLHVRLLGQAGAGCAVDDGLHEGKRATRSPVDTAPVAFRDRYDGDERDPGAQRMTDGLVALYIFMLAAIAGNVIISRVPVILHTPLMSGSNFIHGIVLIGAMVVLGHADTTLEKVIGFLAVLLARATPPAVMSSPSACSRCSSRRRRRMR
jgi:NAD(P) transhydrogenase subunit alpha